MSSSNLSRILREKKVQSYRTSRTGEYKAVFVVVIFVGVTSGRSREPGAGLEGVGFAGV